MESSAQMTTIQLEVPTQSAFVTSTVAESTSSHTPRTPHASAESPADEQSRPQPVRCSANTSGNMSMSLDQHRVHRSEGRLEGRSHRCHRHTGRILHVIHHHQRSQPSNRSTHTGETVLLEAVCRSLAQALVEVGVGRDRPFSWMA